MPFIEWLESARNAAVECILDRSGAKRSRFAAHLAERLEQRIFLSNSALPLATPPIEILRPVTLSKNHPDTVTPNYTTPFSPVDIQKAYGINQISFDGTAGNGAGQTIAIIDAYNDPNIISDVSTFSTAFGLPQFNAAGAPTFAVLNEHGQSSPLPANVSSSTGSWDSEEALDVEWAHSIAPRANIILFEANSSADIDLYTTVATAANSSGVSVVSMSFGSTEFNVERAYDSYFTTPSGHQGVTFLASTGDSGAPGEYPAYSPNVLAVGGTSLSLNSDGSYLSESGWSGGGGGVSTYEPQPSFQAGNVNGLGGSPAHRSEPDISALADFSTGVYIYSTWNEGANNGGYYQAGGTSLACPIWAGLISIANQERVAAGMTTLDGPTQTLPRLYQLPSSDFHDITAGNNGYAATSGYDLSTGIGTPIANLLVPQLAGVNALPSKLVFAVSPSNSVAGAGISPSITVDVEDTSGDIVTGDLSSVTISIAANPGSGTLGGTTTVTAVNGVATFTGLAINKAAAGYTLAVTDGSLTGATSATFNISPASASQVVFSLPPANTTLGVAIAPSVTASVEDAFGNLVPTDSSTVTITLSSGTFSTGSNTASATAVNGVVTFSNLVIDSAGTYTMTASDGSLTGATSGNFNVARAVPTVSVTDAGGTYDGLPFGATDGSAADPLSAAIIASFGSGALSYTYYLGALTTGGEIAAATPLSGAPVSAGTYTVVATYAGSVNYSPSNGAPVNFSIGRRVLDVTAMASSKVYDGTTTATVTFEDDRVGGDLLTLTDSSAVFASRNVGPAVGVSISGISLSGAAALNYTLSSTTASTAAAITPRSVTPQISVASRAYDGTNQATITGHSLVGAVNGDDVQVIGGAATFPGIDVSTALVNVTNLSLGGADSGNYVLSNSTATASASITPRSISGSISANNKIYDATTTASLSNCSLTGVLPGDAVNLSGGTASFNSMVVGTGKTVTASGFVLTGAQAGDYTLANPTETATADILPMEISGTVFDDANANGAMDAGESGIDGRTVDLLVAGKGTKGEKVVKTDAQGNFSFVNIPVGSYIVKVVGTTGWRFTNVTSSGSPVSLQLGNSISGLQFGETEASTISGSVFLAASRKTKRKSAAAGIAGWMVELNGVSNVMQMTAVTDANGSFAFTAVPTGTYSLSIVQQSGYTIAPKSSSLSIALRASKALANENFGEQLISASARIKR